MNKLLFCLAFLNFASIYTAESNGVRSMINAIIPGPEKVLVIMTLAMNQSTNTHIRTFTVEPFDQEKFKNCRFILTSNEILEAQKDIMQAIKAYISTKPN